MGFAKTLNCSWVIGFPAHSCRKIAITLIGGRPPESKSGNFQADMVSVIMGHATLSNSSCDAPAASLAYLVSNSIILCFCFVQAR